MKRIFIKPTPLEIDGESLERKVRKPVGGHLAATGEEVNFDTYWQRRLAEGEVEEATPPDPAPAPTDAAQSVAALTSSDDAPTSSRPSARAAR
ncbi:DUF2635 domain-containing protein [Variovorax gossypii]